MTPADDPPSSVDGHHDEGRHAGDEGRHAGDEGRPAEDDGHHAEDDGRPAEDDGHHAGPHGRRTWPERLAIIGTFGSALLCFVIAAALVGGYLVVRQRNIVDLEERVEATSDTSAVVPQTEPPAATVVTTAGPAVTEASGTVGGDEPDTTSAAATNETEPSGDPSTTIDATTTTVAEAPSVTFPETDPEALNFLVTGADNNACIDEDSPYYGTFGDREGMGERSDTIMVLRVDPVANRVAILSFPRDLYVEIADGGGTSRINSAYQRDEPQRLVDTIYDNFGISIDHYIQVDFCAFKTLVDSVGGVAVPFEYPARDGNTGLNVPQPGCFTFDGEHALAYVRSRHYEYEDPPGSGNWQTDPTSDLGRISRQQDFLRRTLASLLDTGPLNPRVARGLIRATTTYITTDRDLTPAEMMEFAGVMNDVDPGSILTYQIEATGRTIGGAAVLIPNIESENMQAVLAIFRGETSLADAVDQVFEPTTAAASRDSTTTAAPESTATAASESPTTDASESTTATPTTQGGPTVEGDTGTTTEASESTVTESTSTLTESTLPEGAPAPNEFGIVPPRDQTC